MHLLVCYLNKLQNARCKGKDTKHRRLCIRQDSEKLSLVTFYYDEKNNISFTVISVCVDVV